MTTAQLDEHPEPDKATDEDTHAAGQTNEDVEDEGPGEEGDAE
jgi:hypothetical protein